MQKEGIVGTQICEKKKEEEKEEEKEAGEATEEADSRWEVWCKCAWMMTLVWMNAAVCSVRVEY